MKINTGLIFACIIFCGTSSIMGMEEAVSNKPEKFQPLKLQLDALQKLSPSDFGVKDTDSLWSKANTLHYESCKQEQAQKRVANMSWKEYIFSGSVAQPSTQLSPLDQALLKFSRTMSKKEKAWESWHMRSMGAYQKKSINFIFDERDFTEAFGEKLDKNSTLIPEARAQSSEVAATKGIRVDLHSPYYRPIAEPDHLLQEFNTIENCYYHDALKRITTRRHRLSLQAVVEEEKLNAQKNTLINEIKALDSEDGYQLFVRSCLKNQSQEQIDAQYHDERIKLHYKLNKLDQYYNALDNIIKEKESLKQELKALKSPEGRMLHARSFMDPNTFRTIQSLRDVYQAQKNDEQ